MVTELGEGVWWIDLGIVNAYLVEDGGTVTLVDAGLPWHGDEVVDGIVEAGFGLSALDRILLTHYDVDHVGTLDGLADGAAVYAGAEEAPLIAGRQSPGWGSLKAIVQSVAGFLYAGTDVEVMGLTDGESVGGFTVYATPGHTRGHVSYVHEDLRAAFLGDLVRESEGTLHPSPWFLSEDATAVRESVRSLADRTPEFEVAAVGHGVPFRRGGSERLADLAETLPRRAT